MYVYCLLVNRYVYICMHIYYRHKIVCTNVSYVLGIMDEEENYKKKSRDFYLVNYLKIK